jgi:hypothetical protein
MTQRRRKKRIPPPNSQVFEQLAFKVLTMLEEPPPKGKVWTERDLQRKLHPPSLLWKPLLDKLEEGGLVVREPGGAMGTRRHISRNREGTPTHSIEELGLTYAEENPPPYTPDDAREKLIIAYNALQLRVQEGEAEKARMEERIAAANQREVEAQRDLAAIRRQVYELKAQLADERARPR